MGGVEVLQHGQTFFKVRDNRRLDDLAVRLGHQTTHTTQLLHLGRGATRTGVSHHVNRVRLQLSARIIFAHRRDIAHHRIRNNVGTFGPSIDNFVVLLALSDQAVHVLLFELFHLIAGIIHKRPLAVRDHHVVLTERDAGLERFFEAQGHDVVTEDNRLFLTTVTVDRINHLTDLFLTKETVHDIKRSLVVERQKRTQTQAAGCGLKAHVDRLTFFVDLVDPRVDLGVKMHNACFQSVIHLFHGAECHAFARQTLTHERDVVEAQNHILGRNHNRLTVCRRQNVVGGHHQNAGFKLRFKGERHVDRHLVTIKVSVKGRTHQRVKLDGFTLNENRLERLNAKTVKCRGTVQKNRMLADHLIENIPNLGTLFLDQFLGLFHGRGETFGLKT